MTATPLSTIIALARAGSLEHAWYQFAAAGYDRRDEDPAALTVKGRLLKDRALRAEGEERRRLFLESAEAYRRSAALQPGTYPLINAATLAFLAGDRVQGAEIAREVLERIEREPDEPETPYWRGATVAEALLLLGRIEDAKSVLGEAIAAAPRAWEDHASTLRQFILIHEELGADAAWLELLRPPPSLAWTGGASGAAATNEEATRRRVADLIAAERIGFAFGGLGAGVEIVAAEAAVDAGAELHVVLAGGAEAFAAGWVDSAGTEWRPRFEALLQAAETVHMVRPIGRPPSRSMIALGARVAAGAARLNAERLMSKALAVDLDRAEAGAVEDPLPLASDPSQAEGGGAGPRLLALLAIGVGDAEEEGFESRLEVLREALAPFASPALAPHLSGDDVLVGFGEVEEAARAAGAIHSRLRGFAPVRIAGHFGAIPLLRDPFLDAARLSDNGAQILKAIAHAAPPDTICVSLDFAAALAAGSAGASCAHWIGELHAFDGGTAIPLYALRPLVSGD